jgi:hypothetical protein
LTGVRISLIAVMEGFQLLHLLRCKSTEVKYLAAYGLPVFALYWALLGRILTTGSDNQ